MHTRGAPCKLLSVASADGLCTTATALHGVSPARPVAWQAGATAPCTPRAAGALHARRIAAARCACMVWGPIIHASASTKAAHIGCWHSRKAARAVDGRLLVQRACAHHAAGHARACGYALPCHPGCMHVRVSCACGPAAVHRPGHCASTAPSLHAHRHGRLGPRPWPHARRAWHGNTRAGCARALS